MVLLLALILSGCSGVSQAEYDALLLENELLRQELAAYTGSEQTPATPADNKQTNTDNIADCLQIEVVEYTNDWYYNCYMIVTNTSDSIVTGSLSIKLMDKENNIISMENRTTEALGPGESHFLSGVQEKQPFTPAKVEATVVSAGVDSVWHGSMSEVKCKDYTSNDGVIIEATNNGSHAVEFIKADVLFYQGDRVVDHSSDYMIDHENELKPGATLMTEIESNYAFDSYRVFYYGRY